MRITAYAATDVGRHREGNEDNMFSGTTVFAVADGMGGHVAGEVASETALRPIAKLDGQTFDEARDATEALRQAIEAANRNVVGQAQADPQLAGMGTTLTAVMVRDGQLHIAHVGDSRAYLLRDGETINQLTTDHTLVEQLVQDGRLSRDEVATHPQRSVITRAIGVDAEVEVDTLAPLVLQPGDQVLLCSDGLSGPVSDPQISDLLRDEPDGNAAVEQLIQAANDAGGPDNITVVLLRVEGDEGDGATAGTAAGPPPRSIPIRTRPEPESHDWARDMGRYGDRQGVESGTGLDQRPRGRRILAILTGVIVIVGIIIAGGYLVLSRAYFIGEADGNVAIYNGLPDPIGGIALHRELERTDIPLAGLPQFQRQRIEAGIPVGSLTEARQTVEGYRDEIEQMGPPAEPEQPADEPTPES